MDDTGADLRIWTKSEAKLDQGADMTVMSLWSDFQNTQEAFVFYGE